MFLTTALRSVGIML